MIGTGNEGISRKQKVRDAGKAACCAALLLLSGLFLTGALTAYLSDADQMQNCFTAGHNVSTVEENYVPPVLTEGVNEYEKAVRVKNTGNVPCYVRVFLAFSDSESAAHSELSGDGKDFQAPEDYLRHLPSGWVFQESDGYCYYTQALLPGQTTSKLLDRVRTRFDTAEEVSPTELIIYEESIQCADPSGRVQEGPEAYQNAWRQFLTET